jgi:hypothetical protein
MYGYAYGGYAHHGTHCSYPRHVQVYKVNLPANYLTEYRKTLHTNDSLNNSHNSPDKEISSDDIATPRGCTNGENHITTQQQVTAPRISTINGNRNGSEVSACDVSRDQIVRPTREQVMKDIDAFEFMREQVFRRPTDRFERLEMEDGKGRARWVEERVREV